MAFFKWLFGKYRSSLGLPSSANSWTASENGKPTLVVEGSTRERETREKTLAHFRGEPSRHQSLPASFAENQRKRWEAQIEERSLEIEGLQRFLAETTDLGITALRKPEAKIASYLKQLDWQIAEYRSAGVSANLISLAERQKPALAQLAEEIAARIEAKQAMRPPKRTPISDSQLSTELARKVDDLIRLFADTLTMDPGEVDRRFSRAMREATGKMLNGGITYGQASGAPDFLNQDEESFRAFMKEADQDLAWQCDTVSEAFKRYLEIGEIPAPHYPMRVAVLLGKAKDIDREKQFLAAWCMHFPSGNGVTYAALVERAKKVGAISA